jgi:uncharacterized protein with GYD domain
MPLFITQGRFTPQVIKGMLAKSENREEVEHELFSRSGSKLLTNYMTFGDYDFMIVSEGPYEGVATSAIVAAAAGGVVDLKTTLAMSSADIQHASAKAGPVVAHFEAAPSSGRESTAPSRTRHY